MEGDSTGTMGFVKSPMPAAAWELVSLWSEVWDAPRFRGQDQVQGPMLSREAIAPLLKIAASCVVVLQQQLKGHVETVKSHGAYGASRELLVAAIDGAHGADPHGHPVEFVRELTKSAFMTGDGEYTEGLSEAQLDQLLDSLCANQLEQAASLVKDPTATLKSALEKVCSSVQEVLANPPEDGDMAGVANRLLLVQRLERAAEDASAILHKESSEESSQMESSQVETESTTEPMDETDGKEDEESHETQEATEKENPLKRTKSQVAAKLKVQKVKEHQENMLKEVYDLSRTTSALSKREVEVDESEKLRAELAAVEEARKKARNFGEDLLEDMMALDNISGLCDEDRGTRKATLSGLEGLLQDVDTAKSRLAMLHRQLEGKLQKAEAAAAKRRAAEDVKRLKAAAEAARAAAAKEAAAKEAAAKEAAAKEAAAKEAAANEEAPDAAEEAPLPSARRRAKEGQKAAASVLEPPPPGKSVWEKVRLPLRFNSREEQNNYVISATVPGLDLDDLKLELGESSTLRVEGLRTPSSEEATLMRRRIAQKIRQIAKTSPEKFAMLVKAIPQVSEDAYIELGQGEFGRFAETFRLPRDVDVENIDASYRDGVLQIVLPKIQRQLPDQLARGRNLGRGPLRREMHPGLGQGAAGPWGGALFGGHDDFFRW
ncbi:unnamed protein product [Durusdinium trenchii]|uniref:SHSP domain-containing protein n=1 Tax=Durusdinium trenchii TaxID=1381693 RepID=A0ABP0SBD6_9DINO